jgi:hypothetical protein
MNPTRTKLVLAAAFAAVLGGGVGVAAAGGGPALGSGHGDDEPALTGPTLDRASAVALSAAARYGPGGTVTGTEISDDGPYYEVEVTLADGRKVDVDLDRSFAVVGTPEVEGHDHDSGEPDD